MSEEFTLADLLSLVCGLQDNLCHRYCACPLDNNGRKKCIQEQAAWILRSFVFNPLSSERSRTIEQCAQICDRLKQFDPNATKNYGKALRELLPAVRATEAQHFNLPKGQPALFVNNGQLKVCQCRDCERLASALNGWQPVETANEVATDAFDENKIPVLLWVENGGWNGKGCIVSGYIFRRQNGELVARPDGYSGFTIKLWHHLPDAPIVRKEK